jgi:hypothetical protein
LTSACGTAREELDKSWEVFISGEVGPTRIADERVAHNGRPVINGQLRLSLDEELPPKWAKGLWKLRDTRKAVRPQICDGLTDPGTNAVTRDCDTSASTEKLLAGELVVGAGSRQIGNKLIAACK